MLIEKVALENVIHYGIITGNFVDEANNPSSLGLSDSGARGSGEWSACGRLMHVTQMVEKPSVEQARQDLGVRIVNADNVTQIEYYCVFGIYVLTPLVFEELQANVNAGRKQQGEYQLTGALESVLAKEGMTSLVPFGKRCHDQLLLRFC